MNQESKPPKNPILRVIDLVKHFPLGGGLFQRHKSVVRAVDGVSFDLYRGETLGIVGESGCGKSTVARTLLLLEEADGGIAEFDGQDLLSLKGLRLKEVRRRIQVVFQDPYAALNPRMTINQILTEPFLIHRGLLPKEHWPSRVGELLKQVGLRPEYASRYPHEFSGGQLQRIGIARALALKPDVLILDEPVSALDVSVQAQVVNLLEELKRKLAVAYIFIAHDLSIVHHISDRVAVMYLGKIAEIGNTDDIYDRPAHPYTRALLSAEPKITLNRSKKRRILLKGEVPSPVNPPSGCRFRSRCWKAESLCKTSLPALSPFHKDHMVSCHFPITESFTEQ
ncbi:MAG: dipeptide ABC transporter ATP-binding protein [Deltaproteobacteria bacterium]|nr:dipeptide ABC transporter ATP-binding protein [Deltaproteobacteria bacterium]